MSRIDKFCVWCAILWYVLLCTWDAACEVANAIMERAEGVDTDNDAEREWRTRR